MNVPAAGGPPSPPLDISSSYFISSGTGEQHNYNQSGSNNRQFNAQTIHYTERRPQETTPPPKHTVPFSRDTSFVERSELAELQDKLAKPGHQRVALAGFGGVGKSQLAIEHCYRTRDVYPDTWVLWIHASTAARFDQELRNLADDVKIPGRDEEKADILKLVYSWLSDATRSWLIVLDNVDKADFLLARPTTSHEGHWIRRRIECFPVCPHGALLITTRYQAVARRLVDKESILVLKPDEEHARALLQKLLPQAVSDPSLHALAAALEYMPLAIVQAAACIAHRAPRYSIEEFLEELNRSDRAKSSLLKVEPAELELRRDHEEAKNSILLTWQISFEHLRSTRPTAADLLALMSFFDHQAIPDLLIRPQVVNLPGHASSDSGEHSDSSSESAVDDAFEEDIAALRDYSFISAPTSSSFEMHRLVQLGARLWLQDQDLHVLWERKSLEALDSVFPIGAYETWKTCRALYPHASLATKSRTKDERALLSLASILFKAAWFANAQGRYHDAENMIRRSYNVCREQLGEEHPVTLRRMFCLGTTLCNQRREEAEEFQVKVMETMRRVHGEEHPETLASMANLVGTYLHQGRWKDAEKLNMKVIETRIRVLGQEHPETLTSMADLAFSCQSQGWWKEAEKLHLKVIETRLRVLGQENPDTLTSISNLLSIYHHQGQWERVEKLSRRVMEVASRVLGEEHPTTLSNISNYAMTLGDLGRKKEAQELLTKVLETEKRILGEEHPATLTTMSNLAVTYVEEGRLQEAQNLMTRCAESRGRILGRDHPDTQDSIFGLKKISSEMEELGTAGHKRKRPMYDN